MKKRKTTDGKHRTDFAGHIFKLAVAVQQNAFPVRPQVTPPSSASVAIVKLRYVIA
jgi:hypothetical protein